MLNSKKENCTELNNVHSLLNMFLEEFYKKLKAKEL